ncbi:unnamed protein product, partial [Symbiodinium necroappetens]
VQHGIRFSTETLAEFWDHWKKNFPYHPAAEKQPPHHTPIGFSGDDTSYSLAGAKAIVMLVSYVLHEPGPKQLSRFPWCILRYELSLGPATLDPIMKICAWSLNVAYFGSRRLEVARGAVPTQEFDRFENFDSTPRFTASQFFDVSLGRYVCPLVAVAGFTPDMITFCSMHVSNLGLLQWVNGGVLIGLLDRGIFGHPRHVPVRERLRIATVRFREWCALHAIPQSQPIITQGMLFRDPPELTLKAYHSRIFAAFLTAVCHGLINDSSTNDDEELLLWLEVCRSISQWHSKLEDCNRYLLPTDAAELTSIAHRFLRVYK